MVQEKLASLGLEYPAELCSINGMCIGTANVVGLIQMRKGQPHVTEYGTSPLPDMRAIMTWWMRDQSGWLINDAKPVDPFPVIGRLGLFQIDLPEQERS
jgi:hypothetical protein